MKKTAFSLIVAAGMFSAFAVQAEQGPVVSRTETTYSKQNEIVMNGYTPLDEIDNSVKTDVKTYRHPNADALMRHGIRKPVQQVQVAAPNVEPRYMPQPVQGVEPVNGYPVHQIKGQVMIPQNAGRVLPAPAVQPRAVPAQVGCVAGSNCPSRISSIEYKQSPVKVQYPVVRQYPVSIEYPVTVQRNVTVRQPVVVEQPVVVQKPVVVNQPVMVERAPAYIRQQAVRMQQQPSYVQQREVVVQAPAGQVLPPCPTGNCQ